MSAEYINYNAMHSDQRNINVSNESPTEQTVHMNVHARLCTCSRRIKYDVISEIPCQVR